MAVSFTADDQYAHVAADDSVDLNHRAFAITGKVKVTSAAAGVGIGVLTKYSQLHELYVDTDGVSWMLGRNYRANTASVGTGVLSAWMDIALVGSVASDVSQLIGYIRTAGGATQTVTLANSQYLDELYDIWIGGNGQPTLWLRGKAADVKIFRAALTQAEIEAEWAALDNVRTTDYVGRNDLSSFTADEAPEAWIGTWDAKDDDGVTRTTPTFDNADIPSYAASSTVTLSGGWTMPSTLPAEPGIAGLQSAQATVEGGTSVEVTLDAAPTPGNMLVVQVGGFQTGGGGCTITDNQRTGVGAPANVYTAQHGSTLPTNGTTGLRNGMYTLRVPADATAPFTIRATPSGTPAWWTMIVSEVREVDAVTPILGTPASASGTGTSPTVAAGSISTTPALVIGGMSYLNAGNLSTDVAGWTTNRKRDGFAALSSITKRVNSPATESPVWALTLSDSWVATALVLSGAASSGVAPTVTTTALPNGAAGSVYTPVTLAATGTAPIAWSIVSGSLPAGLVLDSTLGVIAGTLTAGATTQTFTVRATNSTGTDDQVLTLTVGGPPVFVTTTLPAGTVGVAYNQTITVTGASTPTGDGPAPLPSLMTLMGSGSGATLTLLGSLPLGLSLNTTTGAITGTPLLAETRSFQVSAWNAYGTTVQTYVLTINAAAVAATISGGWGRWLAQ